jgi:flagellar operon protein
MVDRVNNAQTIQPSTQIRPANTPTAPGAKSFAQTLASATQRQDALRVSSHAQKRLDSSQVTLTDSQMDRIGGAVAKATDKGSNQSLIMLDNMALVVSVKNRVVITAVDNSRMKDAVFTNIDSVVIA